MVWFGLLLLALSMYRCGSESRHQEIATNDNRSGYLNLADSVGYVGMETCRKCHEQIYQTFIQTGMGQSFGLATKEKSAGDYRHAAIHDGVRNLSYHAFWENDSLFFKEFRLEKGDTVYQRKEYVSYVIGSGQHTNSHMMNHGGYVTQMPMTFYTQQQKWDLPPGFENGNNSRFSRKIGLECMTCHNGYPVMVEGSENKYKVVRNGIDCERCHGPGQAHVRLKQSGVIVDIDKDIDYSIVNPAKLPADLQFDVCQRCHLQGNAVLAEGKSFFDFRPGMKLSDVMSVFVARYEGDDNDFIMASHADRLRQSKCYLSTTGSHTGKTGEGQAYKNLTCVTCHNPHVSVKVTGREVFNQTCASCHPGSEEHTARVGGTDCVSCHMPRSGSIDIPHVSITDHRIAVHEQKTEGERREKGRFTGLVAVNNPNPDRLTRAKGFLNHYEKFNPQRIFLDSAEALLDGPVTKGDFNTRVKLWYLKGEYKVVKNLVASAGPVVLQQWLTQKSWDNEDAWTAYRIGESYNLGSGDAGVLEDLNQSRVFFKRAVELAPFIMEFRNKLGVATLVTGDAVGAFRIFADLVAEDPGFTSSYANLGYLNLAKRDDPDIALRYYKLGLSLDPDDETLWMNMVGLHIYNKDFEQAKKVLRDILKRNPEHEQALAVMESLNNLRPE